MRLSEYRRIRESDRANSGHAGGFGRITVGVFRLGQLSVHADNPVVRLAARVAFVPLDVLWSRMAMGAELPATIECGGGLALCHGGRGVIVNPRSRIGSNVTLLHDVTLGNASPRQEAPTIGDGVFIGTKASIIGGVTVGDGARVGAHALVTKDVPPGATARGVPARNFS